MGEFTTAAEAARARDVRNEEEIERVKRAIEAAIAIEGYSPTDPIGQYCTKIGIGIRVSAQAGVEFEATDLRALAYAIELTSVPDVLRRYLDG